MNQADISYSRALSNYKTAKLAVSTSLSKLPHYEEVIRNFEEYLRIRLLICSQDYKRDIFETRLKGLQSK